MKNYIKYKYDLITIKIYDNNHYRYIQQYLSDNGIYWNGSNDLILEDMGSSLDVLYLFVILNNDKYSYHDKKSYLMRGSLYNKIFLTNFNNDPNIYQIEDLDKIKRIIEYGDIQPSYKPIKINRFL